jgi:hypothetical protein
VEGLLFGKRDQGFSLDGGVKAGVFGNKIHNEGSYDEASSMFGGGSHGSDSWSRTKAAFLSELGLNLNYAFTKNIAMTLGYELLYVNNIGNVVSQSGNVGTQSVLYQGSRVGLNFTF